MNASANAQYSGSDHALLAMLISAGEIATSAVVPSAMSIDAV